MTVWNERADEILNEGIWLGSSGVNNWAFDAPTALRVLARLSDNEIAVLGGDVYSRVGCRFQPTSDNWFAEPLDHEAHEVFVSRSVEQARNFISSFPTTDTVPWFTIVPLIKNKV